MEWFQYYSDITATNVTKCDQMFANEFKPRDLF